MFGPVHSTLERHSGVYSRVVLIQDQGPIRKNDEIFYKFIVHVYQFTCKILSPVTLVDTIFDSFDIIWYG